jgi:lipid-A-disaccharide synthase
LLGLEAHAPIAALLPGSRRAEMRYMLPPLLETARALHARDSSIHFALPVAPSVERATLEDHIRRAQLPESLRLHMVDGRAHEVLRAADVALVKPGTATLEAALLGCPLVVVARSSRFTAAVVRRLAVVEFLAMPNLIAGESIVPEFIQEDAEPERIADAVQALLAGAAREQQLARLAVVRESLSKGGAARRAAEIAAEMIGARLGA